MASNFLVVDDSKKYTAQEIVDVWAQMLEDLIKEKNDIEKASNDSSSIGVNHET